MQVGDKFYNRIGFEIQEIQITSINKTKVIFIDTKTQIVNAPIDRRYFVTKFKISRIMILREILLELEELSIKIAEEINEYELKVIMNRYDNIRFNKGDS